MRKKKVTAVGQEVNKAENPPLLSHNNRISSDQVIASEKLVTKADPPLVLTGIPHLAQSFVSSEDQKMIANVISVKEEAVSEQNGIQQKSYDDKESIHKDAFTIAEAVVGNDGSNSHLDIETQKYYTEILGKSEEKSAEVVKTEETSAWSTLHDYWNFVRENPYDFSGWTYLLNHVETMDNIEAVRTAFDGFLPLYPYCFAYWKKYSDLEMKHSGLERCLSVLFTAVKCVPQCVDLWTTLIAHFLQYAKINEIDKAIVKELYGKALNGVGYGWQSSSIWESCISYEQENGELINIINLYKRLLSVPTRLYNKHWDAFLALIRDHHPSNLVSAEEYQKLRKKSCDDLSIPFTNSSLLPPKSLKTTQPEDKLTTHIKEKIVVSYIKIHEKNEKEVDKRWKFEDKIKRPYFHVKPLDKKQLKNWKEYLDFEIAEMDPLRIIILFERCLVACALYEEYWCRYANFMEEHVNCVLEGKYVDQEVKVQEEELGGEGKESVNGGDIGEKTKDRRSSEDAPGRKVEGKGAKLTGKPSINIKNVDPKYALAKPEVLNNEEDTKEQDNQSVTPLNGLIQKFESEMGLSERILMCPPLTRDWVMKKVSLEDVRHIYRRGAWIHCPGKPTLLMQWAEFEELQGNADTARELLASVIAKNPTILKARMQLVELEGRVGNLDEVETQYNSAFHCTEEPKAKSYLAIRYARFLFKVKQDAEKALKVLRKALKKDRGNVHLYHHVFDFCYQRFPIDVQGILAAVLLALASKDLSTEDKYWFAFKRIELLREHGSVNDLKSAKREFLTYQMEMDIINESKEKKIKEEEEKKDKLKTGDNGTSQSLPPLPDGPPPPLPATAAKNTFHNVPPAWPMNMPTGVPGFNANTMVIKDFQNSSDKQYSELMNKGYPKELHDKKIVPENMPFSVAINPSPAVGMAAQIDISKPPPLSGVAPSIPPPYMANTPSMPVPQQLPMARMPPPPQFSQPPPVPTPLYQPPPIAADITRPPPFACKDKATALEPPSFLKRGCPDVRARGEPPAKMRSHPHTSIHDDKYNESYAENGPPKRNGYLIDVDEDILPDIVDPRGEGGELVLSQTGNGKSIIKYWPNYIIEPGRTDIFHEIRKAVKWHQRRINENGDWKNLNRLISWIGPCGYSYKGLDMDRNTHWPSEIVDLLHRLIRLTDNQFNSCLLNLFRSGHDYIPWHYDDHPALGEKPCSAIVSLGEVRMFEMRKKIGKGYLRLPLVPGSVLLLEGATQDDWMHQSLMQDCALTRRY